MRRPTIRFAALRYRTLHIDGWRWRGGYAIDLPDYPRVRFCCHWLSGRWYLDNFDTGMCYLDISPQRRRDDLARQLHRKAPWLIAGGRLTKKLNASAGLIRRAMRLGKRP